MKSTIFALLFLGVTSSCRSFCMFVKSVANHTKLHNTDMVDAASCWPNHGKLQISDKHVLGGMDGH